jgi:hypothetical protein
VRKIAGLGIAKILFALALLCSGQAHAEPATIEQARALVEAMKLSHVAIIGMQLSSRQAVNKGFANKEETDCLVQLPASDLTEIFTAAALKGLDKEETRVATEFYQTDAGRKSVDLAIHLMHAQLGAISPVTEPKISAEDMKAMTAFSNTPVSNKINTKQLFNGPDVAEPLRARLVTLMETCRGKK